MSSNKSEPLKFGVKVCGGVESFRVYQRENDKTDIYLYGEATFEDYTDITIYVRVCLQNTYEMIIDWQNTNVKIENGKMFYEHTIKDVPVGGPYIIDTCAARTDRKDIQWGLLGEAVGHVYVGDLYIIAGQSNSSGCARDSAFDPSVLGVQSLMNNGKWGIAAHPLNAAIDSIYHANIEMFNSAHSPWLSFGRRLFQETGVPIGLLPCALGGSPMSYWNPESEIENGGCLYRNMIDKLDTAGGKAAGVVWYQGCSDTTPELVQIYKKQFNTMATSLRKYVSAEIPFFTVQLNRLTTVCTLENDRLWGQIRELQRQLANEVKNVYIIPSTDLALCDGIHVNAAANVVIGERCARQALKHVYGKTVLCSAPEIDKITVVEDNKLILKFKNVYGDMYAFGESAKDFPVKVEDEDGFNDLAEYYCDGDTVYIQLSRKVGKNTKVHMSWEQNPSFRPITSTLVMWPALSFYDFPVE